MSKKINPILLNFANFFYTKFLFSTIEYNKEYLQENSYIFCPNHTCNLDGYIIWSILVKYYQIDTFMYHEFWENYPFISKLLPLFHVYPITRNKLVVSELKNEIEKLKYDHQSLIIFPQGRHVDPQVMLHFSEYHFKTLPLGAFFLSAYTNKPIVPVFLEPPRIFQKNATIYGKPLDPKDFSILDEKGKIKKERLLLFAKQWLHNINNLYLNAPNLLNRELHSYLIHDNYFDSKGNHDLALDPNSIISYYNEILSIQQTIEELQCNIWEAAQILQIDTAIIQQIVDIHTIYEQSLRRRK